MLLYLSSLGCCSCWYRLPSHRHIRIDERIVTDTGTTVLRQIIHGVRYITPRFVPWRVHVQKIVINVPLLVACHAYGFSSFYRLYLSILSVQKKLSFSHTLNFPRLGRFECLTELLLNRVPPKRSNFSSQSLYKLQLVGFLFGIQNRYLMSKNGQRQYVKE